MNLIVAVDRKWGIGRDNKLLASIPGDMKYFKEHTTGKVVVMGRKTLESMPGSKGLPNRTNYVLTHDESYEAERAIVVNSEEELFAELEKYDADDVYLIGGASMYNKYYNRCNKLYITMMDADLNADTFVKQMTKNNNFKIVKDGKNDYREENGIRYRFVVCERKRATRRKRNKV